MRIRSYKNLFYCGIDNKCCDSRLFGCFFGCDVYFKLCVILLVFSGVYNCNFGKIRIGVVGCRDDYIFDENCYKKSFFFNFFLVSVLLDINVENFSFINKV